MAVGHCHVFGLARPSFILHRLYSSCSHAGACVPRVRAKYLRYDIASLDDELSSRWQKRGVVLRCIFRRRLRWRSKCFLSDAFRFPREQRRGFASSASEGRARSWPDLPKDYVRAISDAGKTLAWERAIGLLAHFEAKRWPPRLAIRTSRDSGPCNAAIDACSQSHEWERALWLLQHMREKNLPVDAIACTAVINSCERGNAWEQSLKIFESMVSFGPMPDWMAYNSGIAACAQGHLWERAIHFLDLALASSPKKEPHIFNSAMSACAKSHRLAETLNIMRLMRSLAVFPDVVTYGAALEACERESDGAEASSIMAETRTFLRQVYFSKTVATGKLSIRFVAQNVNVLKHLDDSLPP